MGYRVKITNAALGDAQEYVDFIQHANKEPEAAEKWFRGLVNTILSLEQLPGRCPVIPEAREFSLELRQRIFYSHRIIFHINEKNRLVTVLRVYHGSRKKIRPEDI